VGGPDTESFVDRTASPAKRARALQAGTLAVGGRFVESGQRVHVDERHGHQVTELPRKNVDTAGHGSWAHPAIPERSRERLRDQPFPPILDVSSHCRACPRAGGSWRIEKKLKRRSAFWPSHPASHSPRAERWP